jgi:hypothetical protein
MAVLVEAVSIIIRKDAIDRAYEGGYEMFAAAVPNGTLCDDERLARVAFLTAAEAEEYVHLLEDHGLVHLEEGMAFDFCQVDQVGGLIDPCRWLAFGTFRHGSDGRIAACWYCDNPWEHWGLMTSDAVMEVATPPNWTYERSLSWAVDAGKVRRVRSSGGGAVSPGVFGDLSLRRRAPQSPSHDRFY